MKRIQNIKDSTGNSIYVDGDKRLQRLTEEAAIATAGQLTAFAIQGFNKAIDLYIKKHLEAYPEHTP